MDITPYVLSAELAFGVAILWITRKSAFDRHLETLIKTEGRKSALEWYRVTPQWQQKRQACFKAFHWMCADCSSPYNLQAHHRNKNAYLKYMGREKPIRDLTCLCRGCHAKVPRFDGLYEG